MKLNLDAQSGEFEARHNDIGYVPQSYSGFAQFVTQVIPRLAAQGLHFDRFQIAPDAFIGVEVRTLFRIAPSRSSRITKDWLGETYGGVAGTDRCSSYTWLTRRQLCWSHLVRDFQKILERGGDSHHIGWYLNARRNTF
jgi:hypothetical protein